MEEELGQDTAEAEKTDTKDAGEQENSGVESLLEAKRNLEAKTEFLTERGSGAEGDRKAGEVSAATIARMMGLITAADFNLLEGKIELVSSKLNALGAKVDRVLTSLGDSVTGNDLDRIDIQLASIRSLLKEYIVGENEAAGQTAQSGEVKKKERKIVSNASEGESGAADGA